MPFDRSRFSLGARLAARLLTCCAIGATACGGRAADALESEESSPGVSSPVDEPRSIGPIRETCEDNPLLAGCPFAGAPPSSPEEPAEPVQPVEVPDEEPLYIAAARNVLLSYCGACHGSVLTRSEASGGLNYIDDWERLIQAGLIELCLPGRSRVVQVMRTREMPPPGSGLPPVSDAEIDFVAQAIELDCIDN